MSTIDEAINYGYKFDMGKYFSNGWDYFKQGAGNYIGFTVIYFILVFIVAMVPFANILSSVIQYTLIAGLFVYTRNQINDRGEFGNFFEGFNSFGQILLYWLVLIVFTMPAIVVFIIYLIPDGLVNEFMSGSPDPEYISEMVVAMFSENVGSIIFLYIALMLYIFYLYISYSFVLILIADRGMPFWDAMETSRKVIGKNFFSFFGMYILLGLMAGIGTIITCGLGALIAIPFINTVIFSAYDDIIGPADEIDSVEIIEEIEE